MDINDIRGLATVLAMVAFLSVTYWAYSGRKQKDFEEAAHLPFADEDDPDSRHNKNNGLQTGDSRMNNKGGVSQ